MIADKFVADFEQLCLADRILHGSDADGIGTYNEKRFHRIFKRCVTENAECYEVRIGRYIADVVCDGRITEIQTASFSKLEPKLRYYLDKTDYKVTVVLPLISEKKVIRADRLTGEIRSVRRSPKRARAADCLSHLYYLRELVGNPRLEVWVLLVKAEEYRYSERVRYRRTGAYECDLYPVGIDGQIRLCGIDDYRQFVPGELVGEEFDAKGYSRVTGMVGRTLYSALNTLYAIDLLSRRKEGNKYIYRYNTDM